MVYNTVGFPVLRHVLKPNLDSAHAAFGWFGLCRRGRPGTSDRRQVHGEASRSKLVCYELQHRALLKVQGQDTAAFLQGLMTNDIHLLTDAGQGALYAHMLNVQGRTLFDIMLYSLKEAQGTETRVLLECDSTLSESVQRHLKMYKIRRKVTISACAQLVLWAVLPQHGSEGSEDVRPELVSPENALVFQRDPRTEAMGWRLVVDREVSPLEVMKSCQQGEPEEYHRHRYAIGVPEGARDLPPGSPLPLEANLVYMRGVSFAKGCYIGQELTARTHHTGVVRKRLMPVSLTAADGQSPPEGAPLVTQSGKPAGRHQSTLGDRGLSLVRLAHAKEPLMFKSPDDTLVTLEASVPDWWPKDTF
ncbi:putative transferase CAF17 homolog, mitochondrial [Brienomyrus brachyistius]|uniref:putative transferase CAF17 homolog, mitochondrial n=1 Tax=Brienomyrus brachyistius TaxID=42636 RepID=UPI0020B253D7|nr:putative transferase CAF17 homolog, mitochondrial [Brienomyrus brachyistius]